MNGKMYYTSILAFLSFSLLTSLSLQACEENKENTVNTPFLRPLIQKTSDKNKPQPFTIQETSDKNKPHPSKVVTPPLSINTNHSISLLNSAPSFNLSSEVPSELSPLSLYKPLDSHTISVPELPSSFIKETPSSLPLESSCLQEDNDQLFLNDEQFKISPILQEQILSGFTMYLFFLLNK